MARISDKLLAVCVRFSLQRNNSSFVLHGIGTEEVSEVVIVSCTVSGT